MSDPPRLDGTDIHEYVNRERIPAKVPVPPKVDLPDLPDWKVNVKQSTVDAIGLFLQSLWGGAQRVMMFASDVAKIGAFVSQWWIPLAAMAAILVLLFALKIL